MRPHGVVLGAEGIEARLLCAQRRLRRPRGFGFERAVQSLMPAILLRVSGGDEAGRDAQGAQPEADAREAARCPRGAEGWAVVAQDGRGHTEMVKALVQDCLDGAGARGGMRHTGEQEARRRIHDRQRIAPAAIARAELAFVVDGPEGIRLLGDAAVPRDSQRRRPPPPPGPDQSLVMQ